jgi:hypothetical protein
MSVTQPFRAVLLPVVAVGPDQIQPRHGPVSFHQTVRPFVPAGALAKTPKNGAKKCANGVQSRCGQITSPQQGARSHGVKNYFSLMASRKSVRFWKV